MTEAMSPFRELSGIGPATESRLHEAGVWDWSDLAEVLHALGGIRGLTVEGLRSLAKGADDRSDGDETTGPDDGERAETFIVRLGITPDRGVSRTTVTHVRNRDERSWAGWNGTTLLRLMCWSADVAEDANAPDAAELPETETEEIPSEQPAAASPSTVVVDGGVVVGGPPRSVDVTIDGDASKVLDADTFTYRARLEARPYGGSDWEEIGGTVVGTGRTGSRTMVTFDDVPVPSSLHRLRASVSMAAA